MGGSSLSTAVFEYLDTGLHVLPLQPSSKTPVGSWLKWRRHKPTKEDIKEWERNGFNVGIITGWPSSLVVFDIDDPSVLDRHYIPFPKTTIVSTGRGLHYYYRVTDGDLRTRRFVSLNIDVKGNGGYVVAPPSVHETGAAYTFTTPLADLCNISAKELNSLYKAIEDAENSAKKTEKLQELKARVIRALRQHYKEGQRDLIVFALAGCLYKEGYPQNFASDIVEALAEEMDDHELPSRLQTVARTYAIEDEEDVRGWSGLEELLGKKTTNKLALLLKKKTKKAKSESKDLPPGVTILSVVDDGPFIAIDENGCAVRRARKTSDSYSCGDALFFGYPILKKDVHFEQLDPITDRITLNLVWRRPGGGVLHFSDSPTELGSALQAAGLCAVSRPTPQLANLTQALRRAGYLTSVIKPKRDGIYLLDGEVKTFPTPPSPSASELIDGLDLLRELAQHFRATTDISRARRWLTCLSFALVAPFSFVRRQYSPGIWLPHLYLTGEKRTGKSTLGEIILAFSSWASPVVLRRKSGSAADTIARLGEVLQSSTFPVSIDEAGQLFAHSSREELIKAATELTIARELFRYGVFTKLPALAPLVLTSNCGANGLSPATLERILVLSFTRADQPTPAEAMKFVANYPKRFDKLGAIGAKAAEILLADTARLFKSQNLLELGAELLREIFKFVGARPPAWAELAPFTTIERRAEIETSDSEAFRAALIRIFLKLSGFPTVDKDLSPVPIRKRVEFTFESGAAASVGILQKGGAIFFTSAVLKALREEGVEVPAVDSLPDFCPVFRPARVLIARKKARAAKARLHEFLDWLCEDTIGDSTPELSKIDTPTNN